jgi:ABC-type dipeptide/oligopeptide/nickel transport system ATPase subunit
MVAFRLLQRRDLSRLLFVHAKLPILEQLGLMKFRAVKHQHLRAPWQLAGGERQRLNVHRGLELRVLHVEVRRCMILKYILMTRP